MLLFRFHREENILVLLSQPVYSQSLVPVLLFHWVQFILIMYASNNTDADAQNIVGQQGRVLFIW